MMEQYLRAKDVAKKLGISIPCVWRWAKSGKLPKGQKLSPKVTVWKESELAEAMKLLEAQPT